MLHQRLITLFAFLLIQPLSSHASTLDEDFQRCASAALQAREQSATVINVITDGQHSHEYDHEPARSKSKYRMLITNNLSGEDLGEVTCTLDYSGNIIAAVFDH